MRNHWSAFIHHGHPTALGRPWPAWTATSGVGDVQNLGGAFPVTDCAGHVFGSTVPWKWQSDSNATISTPGGGPSQCPT